MDRTTPLPCRASPLKEETFRKASFTEEVARSAGGVIHKSHCQSWHTLPHKTRIGDSFSFFASFFLFSKEKKKRKFLSKLTKKGDGAMWASPPTNLPFQKRQGISSMRGDILRGKRHNNYVNRLHKRHPEKQHCRYRKRQTKAFASQRRTARVTSDSAGRVFGVISRIIYPPALSGIPLFKGD